ncbi:MAG: hypothetical protein ACPKPY_06790 [Nitrososphaeraceae archaeon]
MNNSEAIKTISEIINRRYNSLNQIIAEILEWNDDIIIILNSSSKSQEKYSINYELFKEIEELTNCILKSIEIMPTYKNPKNMLTQKIKNVPHINIVLKNPQIGDEYYFETLNINKNK